MNLFKKAAMLCTALLVCLGVGTLSACNLNDFAESSSEVSSSVSENQTESSEEGENSSVSDETSEESTGEESSEDSSAPEEEVPPQNYNYKVSVQNATGATFNNITVRAFDGETEIVSKSTGTRGYVTFSADELALGEYTLSITVPNGYELTEPDKVYKTVAQQGQEIIIPITPKGVMPIPEDGMPLNYRYSLGSVMYDFTVQTSDNNTYTLSQILQEKDLVLLNFWATWCGPCKSEFPSMNSAYLLYEENVSILAMSTSDDKSQVSSFKSSYGLAFDMAHPQAGLTNMFATSSIPVSVIIDRYGVIAYMHTGSMTSTSDFTGLFDFFIGDDYQPTIITNYQGDGGGGIDDRPNRIKPNVSAPNTSDVKSVLAPGTDFEFSWVTDNMSEEEIEYSWPWIIVNNEYLDAANRQHDSSYAQLFGTFTARAGDVLCLDYKINSEANCDIFYIVIDGVIAQQISGYKQNWTTCYAYIFDEHMEGTHSIGLIYNRDGELGSSEGVQIKNMRFERFENLSGVEFDYVYHQGGEVLNPEGSSTQFKYYATPVYNEEDSYYHVGSKDGPILFANLMNVSAWSETSVWLLAYNDYIVYDGFNYKSMFEEYAWQANNNMTNYGYTPVTEELRYLLDIACRSVDVYKVWDGNYHENEWLELCAYYAHYGMTEPFADPMKTITYQGAVELFEGVDNTVNVPFAINPRGFKYKFIPSETAVYNIYSTEIEGATVVTDPECWLMQLDEYGNEVFLGYYTDLVYAEMIKDENGMEVMNGHFNFHHVLNAGETYYILCTTFLDSSATYNVRIEKVGSTYTYMENAAVGPYSFNEVTSELFIPNAINFAYSDPEEGGDGYYHYLNEDGTLGSIIYLDAVRPTAFFNSNDLYQICVDALKYETEKRAFYIGGVDYTVALTDYCFYAKGRTGQYAGFVEVDKDLYEILTAITGSEKYEGTFNSWLMLCYYEKTLSV